MEGPDFLNSITVAWPVYDLIFESTKIPEELSCIVSSSVHYPDLSFIDIEKFNSYESLLRVTARILRFVNNLKLRLRKLNGLKILTLLSDEREEAITMWIKHVQRDVMTASNYKQLRQDLRLVEVDGVVRCTGCLKNALIPYTAKIFLPRSCYLSKLTILHCHVLVKHNGVKESLNELRNKFWVPKARCLIHSVIQKCFLCRKLEGKPYFYPISSPLPVSRLNNKHAFKYTGVDNAGPLYVKSIHGSNTLHKVWIFLITCCSSRAFVLGLVSDCSAIATIRGLRRFFAKRGVPSEILSENGTRFTYSPILD
ncbi:uncharacterized protein LOC136089666 [Hydra vulgaris]|uniref:Uncharacterized protein LOC136089666 n=1 Tax=Hydra vulgaris TaxID=6087 RepID=A0ABM4DBP7_HYDVU